MGLAAARLAVPMDARVEPVTGGVAVHTPAQPDLRRGNALHLDAPPPDPGTAVAAWRAAFPQAVTERVAVCWEAAAGAVAPDGARRFHALELDRLVPRAAATLALRPAVDHQDWDALAGLLEDSDEAGRLAASAGAGRAAVWLARHDGDAVGAAVVFGVPGRSLLGGLLTRPDQRRQGVAATLVTGALAALNAAFPGTAVSAIVAAGSHADDALVAAGFRHARDVLRVTATP